MIDYSHLNSLQLRLLNTRQRAALAKPTQSLYWDSLVKQIEKEITGEYEFLGIAPPAPCTIDEDQLLAELLA